MNQDDDQDEPEGKRGKNGLPALPANLDQLKIQLEQLAMARQASPPDDPKDVAPRFGGL